MENGEKEWWTGSQIIPQIEVNQIATKKNGVYVGGLQG